MKRIKELLRRIKEGNQGFTLVELIIVIAIIGVLAGIATPSVIGYLDQARQDADEASAVTILHAAQAVIASNASGDIGDGTYDGDDTNVSGSDYNEADFYDEVEALLGNGTMPDPQSVESPAVFVIVINGREINIAIDPDGSETGVSNTGVEDTLASGNY